MYSSRDCVPHLRPTHHAHTLRGRGTGGEEEGFCAPEVVVLRVGEPDDGGDDGDDGGDEGHGLHVVLDVHITEEVVLDQRVVCLLYTSPSPRDRG